MTRVLTDMEYIDKQNSPNAAAIVGKIQRFINSHWGRNHSLQNLSYSRYFKKMIRPDLMDEQKCGGSTYGYCCYCMRELRTENDVTLEHIIPDNITTAEWTRDENLYQQVQNLQLANIIVCPGGRIDVNNFNTPIAALPHPHFISYHNLVASCNGKVFENASIAEQKCCNNSRGNIYVYPFYLDNDIDSKIRYTPEGELDFDDDSFDSEWFGANCLNLSSSWLELARRFWYLVSRSDYNVQDIHDAESDKDKRNNIIDDVTPVPDSNDIWKPFVDSEQAWLLLSEYSWFYQYYKTKYPA